MKRRSSRAKILVDFIQQLENGKKNINASPNTSNDWDSKYKYVAAQESGFESVLLTRKRMYYKNIKRVNRLKQKRALSKKRLEIFIKFILYVISNIINILAVINYIVGTFFDNRHDDEGQNAQRIVMTLDVCFSFYFIFEYLLLFLKEQKNLINFIFSWSSFIDAITIGPSIASYFLNIVNLNFLKIFRIFRVFRILRIYKSLKLIQAETMSSEIEEEGFNSLRFDPIKLQFFTIMVILIGVFFIGAGLILGLQDLMQDAWSMQSMNFIDAIYMMIVTYCTLGYGDILPTNNISRILIIIGMFCLIIIVSDQLSKMASLLRIWGPGWIILDKRGHLVVLCDITIDFRVLTETIKGHDPNIYIILICKDKLKLPSTEYPFDRVILINNANFDFETFERANTKDAKAIFVYTTKDTIKCEQKEKITDLLILKLNRFYSEVPIYVQTLYSERSYTNIPNSKKAKMLKFQKIIPIMRLKSLLISKSIFNPGFAPFIQNLMFNDYVYETDIQNYSSIIINYLRGCENKLFIKPLPKFFEGKKFFDVCHMLYFKSIREFFINVSTIDESTRPILLVGINDRTKIKVYKKEKIIYFPFDKIIEPQMDGVFILANNENYLEHILKSFDDAMKYNIDIKKDIYVYKRREGILINDLNPKDEEKKEDGKDLEIINELNFQENINILDDKKIEVLPIMKKFDGKLFDEDEDQLENQFDFAAENKRESANFETIDPKEQTKLANLKLINDEDLEICSEKPLTYFKQLIECKVSNLKKPHQNLLNQKSEETESLSISQIQTKIKSRRPSVNYKLNLSKDSHFKNFATEKNINALLEVEEKNQKQVHFTLSVKAYDRYGCFENKVNSLINKKRSEINAAIVESRIFDLERVNVGEFFTDHIIIIGIQDQLGKLIKLINCHFPDKDIVLIAHRQAEDRSISKLLTQFHNLIYAKGETQNPFHLLNAGLNKSFRCIFLSETIFTKTNEDMGKILSFRTVEYFFNCNTILELWDHSSFKFLGYQPLGRECKYIRDEFLHPLYMAGRLVYLSQFDKLLAKSFIDPKMVEAWTDLLTLGFTQSSNHDGFRTLMGKRANFPVIITIDVPEEYYGKEYHCLVDDLLLMESPALCLGIYIQNPLDYLNSQSSGRVAKFTRLSSHLKIVTSHKRKLKNLEILDKIEQSYKDNLKIIREISYNDKVILDYIDINKTHLPLFVTNPFPGFILTENCQMMILFSYDTKTALKNKGLPKKSSLNKYKFGVKKSVSIKFDNARNKITSSQDNFFCYFDALKDRVKDRYINSLRYVELARASSLRKSDMNPKKKP